MAVIQPSKHDVYDFITKFKELAKENFDFVERREFNKSAAAIGLTRENCFDFIMGLGVRDYEGGPKEDRDRPNELLWEFGLNLEDGLEEFEVYIKLKIAIVQMRDGSKKEFARCFAFHKAEFPLKRPFLKQGRIEK